MPTTLSVLPRARKQPAGPRRFPRTASALAGLAAVALAGCSPVVSIENADVPQWRATALPASPGAVLEDAGKILNKNRIIREASNVSAGRYTLSATCEGGGKAFFAVSLDGEDVVDAGAACNGSNEVTRITLPTTGRLEISTSSVDAPLIYAYQLMPAQ
ncbi:hypothetical protein [Pseudarthrobacter sp. fls2-241-R2A-168]|uniref:hypothetical protein n=1 Tax=Pseudarthrobacter sp. fls2-241-R2A-168 TaxID=3040304 RepID=UPI0025529FD7|nr:hypothetical protein [Pseudarthrobacter sp. fls2-241-R2A-168]